MTKLSKENELSLPPPASIFLDCGTFDASGNFTTQIVNEFSASATSPTVATWYLRKPIILDRDYILTLDTMYLRCGTSINDIVNLSILNLSHCNSINSADSGPVRCLYLFPLSTSTIAYANPYIGTDSVSGLYLTKGTSIDRITVQLQCMVNATQLTFANASAKFVVKMALIPK